MKTGQIGQPFPRVLDCSLWMDKNVVMAGTLVNAADINKVANNGETVLSASHTIYGRRYVKKDETMPISVLTIISALKLLLC